MHASVEAMHNRSIERLGAKKNGGTLLNGVTGKNRIPRNRVQETAVTGKQLVVTEVVLVTLHF